MNAVITLSHAHWTNERDVIVGDLATSSRVNGPGRLSCHIGANDAHAWGFPELKGCWVYATTAYGPWAGFVEDDPAEVETGILELSCIDMAGMLEIAITSRTYRQYSSAPGSLINRTLRDSGLDEPLWITEMVIDESGQPQIVEFRGDNTANVVQGIANRSGGLLTIGVDTERTITLTYQTEPRDRRDSILLVEGREVISGSIRPSISNVVNDLTGVANDRDWQRAAAARVTEPKSIRRYGQRRRETRLYTGHTRASSILPVARNDLAKLAWASGPVSLSIWDEHPIVSELALATVVTLWSSTNNKVFDLTITGLGHDTGQHVVTIVGTVTEQG